MVRTDIAAMASALRGAFASAGPDVQERTTGTGRAFVVDGRVLGQVDERSGALRVRLWLPEGERSEVEQRPTYDGVSGWLHVVSDGDVEFVRGVAGRAYRAVAAGEPTATPTIQLEVGPAPEPGQQTRAASPPPSTEKPAQPRRAASSGKPSRSRAPRRS